MNRIDCIALRKFKCHKEVLAAKITDVTLKPNGQGAVLSLLSTGTPPNVATGLEVPQWFVEKHLSGVEFSAILQGYFVVYADGYTSYSPGPVFEDGYAIVEGDEYGSLR